MARRLRFDIPGRDWRVDPNQVRAKGWEEVFAPELHPPFRFVVEFGFGRGEFLMHLASEAPETAHVGVEVSFKRVLKTARRLARRGLCNVRLVHGTAQQMVDELLEPDSVDEAWINFPDPWPKKRHHKRRLLRSPFVSTLAARLRAGGRVHISTDHAGYAEEIDASLRSEGKLENAYAPAPYLREVPGRLPTAYELEWRRDGRELFYWAYRRRSNADSDAP